ncbi:hypothetical protein BegalDRAFT_3296 [Beggiatoa alba B18LD]|uniref:Uncharacterized protein n=1 Tax=Beggiatoa alba B18LD TaxID=395493 RepID=I3CKH2_9GAMM|nr:hypothetical protein [Beggiatoa alba]EIJ44115.1 hypothetical protein BegalDRAFT_3296 [Beggiatoa alba B18LD]
MYRLFVLFTAYQVLLILALGAIVWVGGTVYALGLVLTMGLSVLF